MFGFFRKRAAKKYARRLGPYLQKSYGRSEHYSVAQVRAAVERLGLPAAYICFGFAAYLPEADYAALAEEMPHRLPYREARTMVARHVPSRMSSPYAEAREDVNVWSAADN